MLYFSTLLESHPYKPAADRLFAALRKENVPFTLLSGTKDIWLRDFMPVKTADGRYVSFRYEPSYLNGYEHLRTTFADIAADLPIEVQYSDINLDGGSVVLSPSRKTAIISDRVYAENTGNVYFELTRLLGAQVIVIPSRASDMTGHADGMVRFVDEKTVIGNRTPYKDGLEQHIKRLLGMCGIRVIGFPYFDSPNNSAVGTYLNFLETENVIFLPVFGCDADEEAVAAAKGIFAKKIVPVRCEEIAAAGGCLNCISWET